MEGARGPRSGELFARATRVIPGGVNSPVRAFKAVGGTPVFVAAGKGAWIEDVDGNRYVDWVQSWGALLLGHAHPRVLAAARAAAERGTTFGAPTESEVLLAEKISSFLPGVEMLRLVSSGTEAVMSAVRLARGFTGRQKVVKFAGCYHGHADGFLVAAGSGAAAGGVPDSAGVPPPVAAETVVLPYNDTQSVKELFSAMGGEVACVVVEPVAANMGLIPPEPGFLETLREKTEEYGALLIFDEVITGFRVGRPGAQGLLGIHPDLTCLGKVIGGGFPLAAFGGRRDVMSLLAPEGPVYQAGTLSGNPVAVAAGLAVLEVVEEDPGLYSRLEGLASALARGLEEAFLAAGIPARVQRYSTLLSVFFTASPVRNFEDARAADRRLYSRFFHAMLARGIYLPPSPLEAVFPSAAHGEEELELTLEAARAAAWELKASS